MSTAPTDILQVGQRILAESSCEADRRASIGRFYYAAYHHGLSFEDSKLSVQGNAGETRGGVHARLISRLLNPAVQANDPAYRTSKQLGYILRSLRVLRVKADYYINEEVDARDAHGAEQQSLNALKI